MSTTTLKEPENPPSNRADCSLARLKAVAKNCRNRGGDCDCYGVTCKAVSIGAESLCGLLAERQRVDRDVTAIEDVMRRVQTAPATLREGFKFREGLTPVMVIDGDGTVFGYEDKDGSWVETSDWPFNDSMVWPDDCVRFGIRVE